MSTKPIYQYTWQSGWSLNSGVNELKTDDEWKADIKNGIGKAMLEKLMQKLAEVGKWVKVDSVAVSITSYERTPSHPYEPSDVRITAQGTTIVIFQSDATPDEKFSPQGWTEILWAIIALVEQAIMLHGTLFFVVLIIIALTIFTLAGGFKGVLFGPGGGGGLGDIGTIIVICVLGLGALIVLPSLLGKKGRKR